MSFCRTVIYRVKRKIRGLLKYSEEERLLDIKKNAQFVGKGVRAFGDCIVNDKTEIGDCTIINNMNIIGSGKCKIGMHCHLADGVTIITSNHNYNGNGIPYDLTNIEKGVIIGDFVWIGAHVIILPGVVIGEGAIIQAGSVVRVNVPAYAFAGGACASVFKYRDIEHFKRMKQEKKWF